MAQPINVNFFAQSFARETLSRREEEGLVVCEAIPSTFTVYIKPHIIVRFNALGSDFVVHNIGKTALKAAWFGQKSIAGIDSSATRLTVGYLPNEAKTDMACVAISLQVGQDRVYHFPIDGSDEGALPIPAPLVPPAPILPSEQLSKAKPR